MKDVLEGIGMIVLGCLTMLGGGAMTEFLRGLELKFFKKDVDDEAMTFRCVAGGAGFVLFGVCRLLTPALIWILDGLAKAVGY